MVAVETSLYVGNILWMFYDCLSKNKNDFSQRQLISQYRKMLRPPPGGLWPSFLSPVVALNILLPGHGFVMVQYNWLWQWNSLVMEGAKELCGPLVVALKCVYQWPELFNLAWIAWCTQCHTYSIRKSIRQKGRLLDKTLHEEVVVSNLQLCL